MPIPIRTLRAHVEDLPGERRTPSARELDREDRILDIARALMARYGRANLTLGALAAAMRLAPATIRRHFPDLDSILAELIRRHLHAISVAIGEATRGIPFHHPNRHALQRAAYVAFTRNAFSGTTPDHTLLIRERHTLPPDLLDPLENLRDLLGGSLGAANPETILSLLDNPFIQPPQIEAMLAALQEPSALKGKIKTIQYPNRPGPAAKQAVNAAFPPPAPQARAGPVAATA